MISEDVATARAATAEAEEVRWKCNREDMIPAEREATLVHDAYDKRMRYQLRDDPISV